MTAAVCVLANVGLCGFLAFAGIQMVYQRGEAAERHIDRRRLQDAGEGRRQLELSKQRLENIQRRLADGNDAEAPACRDASRWDQMQWEYLSTAEANSWLMLGWNQTTWDIAHPLPPNGIADFPGQATPAPTEPDPFAEPPYRPPADSACFQDLDSYRRDAVLTLGYTIQTWHACKNTMCQWPDNIPKPEAPCLDHFLYLESKYDLNPNWYSLSDGERKALVNLGWDWEGLRWATKDKPPIYSRPWTELLPREREAAEFLGYRERVWHLCEAETKCITRLELLEARFAGWRWRTMARAIRDRLEELGWSERSWLEGEEPAPLKLTWLELPYSQRQSAQLLGYSEDTWMKCPTAPCLERFRYVTEKYEGVQWHDMKLSVQRAWMLLEHSPSLWAAHGAAKIETMQVRWEELSAEQRRQAAFLGHSLGTWQGCNQNWVAPDAGNVTAAPLDPLRIVRGRMTIQRPFTEISGNVYGAQVATLPTSFIEMFERSVARALFCGNPPLSPNMQTYVDVDGDPLCIVRSNYEMQKRRIKVVTVVEGSIIVDFRIQSNYTTAQPTSAQLFAALNKLLESQTSPLCQDSEFGRFARVGTVEEVPYANLKEDQLAEALEFEKLRGAYGDMSICQLESDSRDNPKPCVPSAAQRRAGHGGSSSPLAGFVGLLSMAAALAIAAS